MLTRTWLAIGVAGIGLLASMPERAAAWGIPVHVDAGVNWRFNVSVGAAARQFSNRAPWYAYFPTDAYTQRPPAASRYPSWPTNWPPQSAPAAPSSIRRVGYGYPSYWYGQ